MMQKAVIIGHADGDGHLISEQTRRNLADTGLFDITVVVDPERTRDHKSWLRLKSFSEIEAADFVFFVDMMFGPQSFVDEARSLVNFVNSHSDKQFFLVDHHPLPLGRLAAADNLRVVYRPDVSRCVFGPESGMMVVAALCERQFAEIADLKTSAHEVLAVGIRRAAAAGGPLAGEKLLALLKADEWEGLFKLGAEDQRLHYLPRGRRPVGQPQSETLKQLDEIATYLLDHPAKQPHPGRTAMAYDIEVGQQELSYEAAKPKLLRNVPKSPKDLGVIVTLLELAALSLTTTPGATFTLEELIREAQEFAGDVIKLEEHDIRIVLKKKSFLEKVGSTYRLR